MSNKGRKDRSNAPAIRRERQPEQRSSGPSQSQITQFSLEMQAELFSGPLPPPDLLIAYENVHPGLADRIVKMAEQQAIHRQGLETHMIRHDTGRSKQGLYAGVWLATLLMVLSSVLILQGQSLQGSIFAGGTALTLVGTFLYEARQRRQERLAKQRLLTGQPSQPKPNDQTLQ